MRKVWTRIYWDCKYKDKTLPQVLFLDPDWFFFMIESKKFEDKGPIVNEANEINLKARNIRISDKAGKDLVAEYYIYESSGKFFGMAIVSQKQEKEAETYCRTDVIDLSIPHQMKSYDKWGNSLLISQVKWHLFGSKSYRMTKKKCEAFFDDDKKFVL
jgi:hypothetical protein